MTDRPTLERTLLAVGVFAGVSLAIIAYVVGGVGRPAGTSSTTDFLVIACLVGVGVVALPWRKKHLSVRDAGADSNTNKATLRR